MRSSHFELGTDNDPALRNKSVMQQDISGHTIAELRAEIKQEEIGNDEKNAAANVWKSGLLVDLEQSRPSVGGDASDPQDRMTSYQRDFVYVLPGMMMMYRQHPVVASRMDSKIAADLRASHFAVNDGVENQYVSAYNDEFKPHQSHKESVKSSDNTKSSLPAVYTGGTTHLSDSPDEPKCRNAKEMKAKLMANAHSFDDGQPTEYVSEAKRSYVPLELKPVTRANNYKAIWGTTIDIANDTSGTSEWATSTRDDFPVHQGVQVVRPAKHQNYTVSAGLAGWEGDSVDYVTTQRGELGRYKVNPAQMKADYMQTKQDSAQLKSFLSTTHYVLGTDISEEDRLVSTLRSSGKDAANYTYTRPKYDKNAMYKSTAFDGMQTETQEPDDPNVEKVEYRGRMIRHHAGSEATEVCTPGDSMMMISRLKPLI